MDPISNNPNSNNPQDLASTDTDQHALNLNTPSVTDNSLPTSNVANLDATNRSLVGTIELLEERAVVDKERLDIGKVTVTKQVRTKTINVPVELVEEVMVIETEYYDADSRQFLTTTASDEDLIRHIEPTLQSRPSITVNGTEMFLDQEPIEIVLSRQVAVIKKETYAVQDVAIEKSTHIHKDTFDVELKHEELDVKEEGYFDHEVRKP
ncbi:YsnF/AvaK domain-containing protein [Psychrobacter sanguinis]|uniref:YsnF/AvaK domain-containing protein n=1 Tax=Psychrobacter sanguinis TaxID=861445 RepID=UPI00020C65D4|nr:YsnF/AvaK domain-containing protein [Psychrobacter sanguinis]EGK08468.1 hypothetical protein HMPREF9373_2342 [Psychrobacter sp. 1501(2011)]MCC3306881.1 YsnF/AvaK domain-containing protein [Psychrobacter sanguinis]MCC3345314.1 YsnF/AvaK domain-containing protein [Psychrobacter sanguinis]MCD9152188.1 YsnF/AvaK domain-containing protein [Psychrobacter sanguinis]MDY3307390.1 YsnF/AvaK domain-containing protein [Psychrobacter sanguinis]